MRSVAGMRGENTAYLFLFAPGTYAEHMHTVILVGLRLTCPHRPVPPSCSISGWPHCSQSCKSLLSPSRSFRSRAPPGVIRYPRQTYRNQLSFRHRTFTQTPWPTCTGSSYNLKPHYVQKFAYSFAEYGLLLNEYSREVVNTVSV
jgi:hypothetical protein